MRPALHPAGHWVPRMKPTCLLHTWRPHRRRPFTLVLHLHQHHSSRNLHLQYLVKNQSTQRCQSLITQGSAIHRSSNHTWSSGRRGLEEFRELAGDLDGGVLGKALGVVGDRLACGFGADGPPVSGTAETGRWWLRAALLPRACGSSQAMCVRGSSSRS
jgi:hypothetical protein